MNNEEYIGLDVGKVRTGFARGSSLAKIAEPIATYQTTSAVSELEKMIKDNSAVAVVVGLPRSLDGNETEQTEWVRQWVDVLKVKINIPVYAQDEALTSKIAEVKKAEKDLGHGVDALAASIILQDFLETPEADRSIW